jgi:hypothetical protein
MILQLQANININIAGGQQNKQGNRDKLKTVVGDDDKGDN